MTGGTARALKRIVEARAGPVGAALARKLGPVLRAQGAVVTGRTQCVGADGSAQAEAAARTGPTLGLAVEVRF